jgi:hypothetical protein
VERRAMLWSECAPTATCSTTSHGRWTWTGQRQCGGCRRRIYWQGWGGTATPRWNVNEEWGNANADSPKYAGPLWEGDAEAKNHEGAWRGVQRAW